MGMGGGMGSNPPSRSNAESTTLATLHVTGDEATPLPPVPHAHTRWTSEGAALSASRAHLGHGDGHGWRRHEFHNRR